MVGTPFKGMDEESSGAAFEELGAYRARLWRWVPAII